MTGPLFPPILYYHRVSPDADRQNGVTPSVFRDQITWLSRLGFRGITLDQGLSGKVSERAGARSPVIITFDDGYEDNYQYAAPILEEFGFLATIFFVTEKMGQRVDWTTDPIWKDHRLMDRRQARELVERGFEAGSHTLTHPDLSSLPDSRSFKEIAESRQSLSNALSCPVTTFCYPYGSFSERHVPMVRDAGYRAARTVQRYHRKALFDPYRLACRPIPGRMSLFRFILTNAAYRLGLYGVERP